jgi:Uma2 family endonuclease
MSALGQPVSVSFEDFLRYEQAAPGRHELVGGLVYAMSGGTERHEIMKDAIYSRWRAAAIAAGCRPFTGRMLRVPSGDAYYPDVLIVCGPAAHTLYETSATMIVEVGSPNTRSTDRREKVVAYGRIEEIRAYMLVDPVERRIEIVSWSYGEPVWEVMGPGEVVTTRYGDLVVDELYDEVSRIVG